MWRNYNTRINTAVYIPATYRCTWYQFIYSSIYVYLQKVDQMASIVRPGVYWYLLLYLLHLPRVVSTREKYRNVNFDLYCCCGFGFMKTASRVIISRCSCSSEQKWPSPVVVRCQLESYPRRQSPIHVSTSCCDRGQISVCIIHHRITWTQGFRAKGTPLGQLQHYRSYAIGSGIPGTRHTSGSSSINIHQVYVEYY